MPALPHFHVIPLQTTTRYAPLAVLGCYLREHDLFSPLRSRLQFPPGMHTAHPQEALIDVLVSILAGCRAVQQVNTHLRPDRLLAQAWGRQQFAEQSTLARLLDGCQSEQVQQAQDGITQMYRWIGRAPQHDWRELLPVDIDLTFLPAGEQAQGATPGYASGKKGGMGASCAALAPPAMTKSSARSCFQAIPSAI